MGLRVRLRRTFTSKKNSTGSETGPNGEPYYTSRKDIQYYKPNEIPKSKYRGKVDPEHQASLQAFSLADAFSSARRRTSLALSGTFSPGGTNSQSAAASRAHSRVASRRPSIQELHGSALRNASGVDSEGSSSSSNSTSRQKSTSASMAFDADTASTSLSDQATAVPSAPAEPNNKLAQHDSGIHMPELADLSKQATRHDTPFTAEELEQAMTRATLKQRDFGERGIGVAL
ncbi:hypothetical protein Z517_00080 [Fonsecaea pedrosoi CBS 271.37]|uniref:Unplaced genomic scaffold supercont1.1, whole genome shotgun sequence n=1 Tax=Fonsecaea pedrosoi CBS 271.37 TaxID=1442368 RepID=A0A0D2FDJ5_9EURO|nr:uncharacterized protein Z517_00080 [Fonsecaea pedrosoi CBS 271.37]KIW84692.1 hypothetical protein Z517_00080 [Fonsecaea pedrosoi CBS 271.37]